MGGAPPPQTSDPFADLVGAPPAAPAAKPTYQSVHGAIPSGPPIDADGLAQQVSGQPTDLMG